MDAVERAIGAYLALYYLSMSVIARGLWQAGRRAVAVAVLALPLLIYGVWSQAGDHPLEPRRLQVTLALAPVLAVPLAAAGTWALEGAGSPRLRRLARLPWTIGARLSPATRGVLLATSIAGMAWWASTLWDAHRCAGGDGAPAAGTVVGCVLPGLGAWPALIAGLWRTADRERRALERRALEGVAHA
jgi:hypothetical protein